MIWPTRHAALCMVLFRACRDHLIETLPAILSILLVFIALRADQYTKPCFSSPVSSSSASEPGEISLFLHQILFRSSSSSTTSLRNAKLMLSEFLSENPLMQCQSPLISDSNRLVRDVMNSSTGVYFPVGAGTASSSVGGFDNDLNEYDCESEGDLEALVGEVAAKAAPLRSSSKGSRATEVHNSFEKRSDGGGGRSCCSGDTGSSEDGEALDRFSARSRRGSPALHGPYDVVLRVRLRRLQELLYVRCNYS